jgi:hypothetical protein
MMFADFIAPGFLQCGALLLVAAGKAEISGNALFFWRDRANIGDALTGRSAGWTGILFGPSVKLVS